MKYKSLLNLEKIELISLKKICEDAIKSDVKTKFELKSVVNWNFGNLLFDDFWNMINTKNDASFQEIIFVIDLIFDLYTKKENIEKEDTTILTAPGEKITQTREVIESLVKKAEKEIMLIGYDYSEFGGFKSKIRDASRRDVKVYIIGETKFVEKLRNELKSVKGKIEYFAYDVDVAKDKIVEGGRTPSEKFPPKFHAKVIIRDRKEGLITSANLTYQGVNCNVEIGTKIDRLEAKSVVEWMRGLIQSGLLKKYENWR